MAAAFVAPGNAWYRLDVKEACSMFGLGFGELLILLAIVLVVFGAGKLPQLGDGLGRAIKNFKRSASGADEIEVTPKQPAKEIGDRAREAETKP
jgi:sec-independent protein translocase protein TatA